MSSLDDTPQIPVLRPRKILPPIRTATPPDTLSNLRRPVQTETIIFKGSPEPSPELPNTGRRTSRNILGIFSRTKAAKEETNHDVHVIERRRSNNNGNVQERSKRLSYLRKDHLVTGTESPADPPAFADALSQAVKHITLAVPSVDADTLLQQHERLKQEELDNAEAGVAIDATANKTDQKEASYWKDNTFILTNAGSLLQYAAVGTGDRLPERWIQLGNESAAFASDAIPGKHWVLQISRCFGEETASTSVSRSRLSRMGIWGSSVKTISANHVLMVMENTEDMESWLASVRQIITSKGSDTYQQDKTAEQITIDPAQRLQERASRTFVIEKASGLLKLESRVAPIAFQNPSAALNSQRELFASFTSGEAASTAKSNGSADAPQYAFARQQRSLLANVNGHNTPPESPPVHQAINSDLLLRRSPVNHSSTISSASSEVQSTTISHERNTSTTRSYRSASLASDSTPNYSVPSFSQRFSHSTRSATTTSTPPQSAGSSPRSSSSEAHLKAHADGAVAVVVTRSSLSYDGNKARQSYVEDWSDSEEKTDQVLELPAVLPQRQSALLVSTDPPDEDQWTTAPCSPAVTIFPTRASSLSASPMHSPTFQRTVFQNVARTRPLSTLTTSSEEYCYRRDFVLPQRNSSLPSSPFPSPGLKNGFRNVSLGVPDAFAIRRALALKLSWETLQGEGASASPVPGSSEEYPAGIASRTLSRPRSLQPLPADQALRQRMSMPCFDHRAYGMSMTTREREEAARATPVHMLGPPLNPPPSQPLPPVPEFRLSLHD